MQQLFTMLATYNRWANRRLYDAAAALSEEEYRRDVGAFFRSMNGTLNHLLVADRIWMKRFTGTGDAPASLDVILYDTLERLRPAREAEDQCILDYVHSLTPKSLAGRFTYLTATDMRTVSQRISPALSHLFNHHTHHRGQAHTILSLLGKAPPPLDLIYFQRTPEGQEFA